MTEPQQPTGLILVVDAGAGVLERLNAALAVSQISSVVVRAPAGGRPLDAAGVKPLVAAAQASGAAALIEADARLARTLKADGVHIPVADDMAAAYAEAREIVGTGLVVGLDAGRSRHDAMTAGEDGADYVGFGIPAFVKDREASSARRLELIAWWAEIFEVPSVAFDVASADEAGDLARAGADFVAVTLSNGTTPAAAHALVQAFAAAIRDSDDVT
ncbi:MAG: thiamine phosphate synthase [Hyphomicrobiaceae bacterium]